MGPNRRAHTTRTEIGTAPVETLGGLADSAVGSQGGTLRVQMVPVSERMGWLEWE